MESTNTANKQPATTTTTAVKAPPKDTRFKTEDVTNTKGLTFEDFGLSQEV